MEGKGLKWALLGPFLLVTIDCQKKWSKHVECMRSRMMVRLSLIPMQWHRSGSSTSNSIVFLSLQTEEWYMPRNEAGLCLFQSQLVSTYVSHSAYGSSSCSVQLLYIYAEENCYSDFCSSQPKYYVSWTLLVIMNCTELLFYADHKHTRAIEYAELISV